MILWQYSVILTTCWILKLSLSEPTPIDTSPLRNIANVSYAQENVSVKRSSILFPRLDFDQWKPLTGRGDPLRNDPTYDYEPPVLDRVHYWADDTRFEREHIPERKSEILVLGVSSRKPSVTSRQPPPRRHYRPQTIKYENFAYKLSENYPMTILVPPPPPPLGYKPMLFGPPEQIPSSSHIKVPDPPKISNISKPFTSHAEHVTSLYSLQESNLIYQSSTTNHDSIFDYNNQTKSTPPVNNEYVTTSSTKQSSETESTNDFYNFISSDHSETTLPPYSFYKPMLSESPPSLPIYNLFPSAKLTAPPAESSTEAPTTVLSYETTTDSPVFTDFQDFESTTTEQYDYDIPTTSILTSSSNPQTNIFDMLSPMMSMPLINEQDTLENNFNFQATENHEVFKNYDIEDLLAIDNRKPLKPEKFKENTIATNKFKDHKYKIHDKLSSSVITLDPYLHMRYTTPLPTTASSVETSENPKVTPETATLPMHSIIQGHSKVKTYGSLPTKMDDNNTLWNEILKPNETNEVKHLHPIKQKTLKTDKVDVTRRGKVHSLKSLVDKGHGSIEIQETNLGIKYDVSDGSDVPLELYKKGIIFNNDDSNKYDEKKVKNEKRAKRQIELVPQIDLEDVLPYDDADDTIDEYVYKFFKGQSNETGLTGLIAQAITGKKGVILDVLDDDDDEEEEER